MQNLFIAIPYSRLFSLQNIPFTAAHTHIAHIHKHLSMISIVPTQVNSRFQNSFFWCCQWCNSSCNSPWLWIFLTTFLFSFNLHRKDFTWLLSCLFWSFKVLQLVQLDLLSSSITSICSSGTVKAHESSVFTLGAIVDDSARASRRI